jgi:hypothetical protein
MKTLADEDTLLHHATQTKCDLRGKQHHSISSTKDAFWVQNDLYPRQ